MSSNKKSSAFESQDISMESTNSMVSLDETLNSPSFRVHSPLRNSSLKLDKTFSFFKEHSAHLKVLFPRKFCEKFSVIEKIGKGSQGVVYRVEDKNTQQIYAAKLYQFQDEEHIVNIRREAKILQSIKHPNFIKYHEFYDDEPNECFVLITEFFEAMDLEGFLSLQNEGAKIELILTQIFDSIEYLHSKKISHGDLNLNNILIDSKTFKIKIIDFGLAKVIQNSDDISPCQGNFNFRPPKNLKFSSAYSNDVWSVALIAMSLFKGKIVHSRKALKILKKTNKNLKVDKIANILKGLFENDCKQYSLSDFKKSFDV